MTARMQQFEHILATDLPQLFEDAELDQPARDAFLRHADELKDWMSGILEWHRQCVRYTEPELKRLITPAAPAFPADLGMSARQLADRFRGASA
ncbi:hypothetical protein [Amycolatopsis methanolica]|uniref:hypothetical protein n=1 Tax=Amycolatopsis methanolica TaxID=1814 RepID=UPI00343CFCA5